MMHHELDQNDNFSSALWRNDEKSIQVLSLRIVYISNLYFSVFTNNVTKWKPQDKKWVAKLLTDVWVLKNQYIFLELKSSNRLYKQIIILHIIVQENQKF